MTKMPTRICKGDKVRLKSSEARKYGRNDETVFDVALVEKIGGRPRLYVDLPKDHGRILLWANDCVLAWGRSCAERRKALGL